MKKLLISFSGGRTSAYMTLKLMSDPSLKDVEKIVVFANTGKEHEKTLEFTRDFERATGIKIIWIEAKHQKPDGKPITKKGWGASFKIVDFETASREGEPFEEMILVLGIPCSEAPFCSPQLKKVPIEKYCKSIGWKKYHKAIGIRIDEVDRVNPNWIRERIIYPLISSYPTTKGQIIDFFKSWEIDFLVPKNLGNCNGCWKKSWKTLASIAQHTPDVFDWWEDMIEKYSKATNEKRGINKDVSFYRGNTSIKEIFKMSEMNKRQLSLFEEKEKTTCSESCEAF